MGRGQVGSGCWAKGLATWPAILAVSKGPQSQFRYWYGSNYGNFDISEMAGPVLPGLICGGSLWANKRSLDGLYTMRHGGSIRCPFLLGIPRVQSKVHKNPQNVSVNRGGLPDC